MFFTGGVWKLSDICLECGWRVFGWLWTIGWALFSSQWLWIGHKVLYFRKFVGCLAGVRGCLEGVWGLSAWLWILSGGQYHVQTIDEHPISWSKCDICWDVCGVSGRCLGVVWVILDTDWGGMVSTQLIETSNLDHFKQLCHFLSLAILGDFWPKMQNFKSDVEV